MSFTTIKKSQRRTDLHNMENEVFALMIFCELRYATLSKFLSRKYTKINHRNDRDPIDTGKRERETRITRSKWTRARFEPRLLVYVKCATEVTLFFFYY